MLLDIFVLPSSGRFVSDAGLNRLIESVGPAVCDSFMKVTSFADINQQRKNRPFYGVFYDNEYFDPRLAKAIPNFLIYSRGIDLMTVFIWPKGSKEILFQPRIFKSKHNLNPDRKNLPLPLNEKDLISERILDGWVYSS